MIKIKSILSFLVVLFAIGMTVAMLPQAANAQTDKQNKQEGEDDDKDDDEKLSAEDRKQAKISLDEARAIALKRVSGRVVDEELEKEKGRLQYAFDIKTADGKIFDVEIDAMTGEVLQAKEDDDDDGDTAQRSLRKTKNSVYRAAGTVKSVTEKV